MGMYLIGPQVPSWDTNTIIAECLDVTLYLVLYIQYMDTGEVWVVLVQYIHRFGGNVCSITYALVHMICTITSFDWVCHALTTRTYICTMI